MKKELKIYQKWEKANVLYLSAFLLGLAVGKKKNRVIKPFLKNIFVVLKKNKAVLYWPKNNYEKAVKKINDLIVKKPKYLVELLKQIQKKTKEIKKIMSKIKKLNLNKKSDQELIKLLEQVYKLKIDLEDLLVIPNICVSEYKNFAKDEVKKNKAGFFIQMLNQIQIEIEQVFVLIIKEISRRTFYSVKQLCNALPVEIRDIFKKKGLRRFELDQRADLCIGFINKNGIFKILYGDEVKIFIKKNVR